MTLPSSFVPQTLSRSLSNSFSVTIVPYRVYSRSPLQRAKQANSAKVMPLSATSLSERQQLESDADQYPLGILS